MSKPLCTVCVLLYGDYPELHRQCLQGIVNSIPADVQLRIGLNQVCEETRTWLEEGNLDPQMLIPGTLQAGNVMRGIEQSRTLLYSSKNENIKKYPMMRRMLWDDKITTRWVVWFDDDTLVVPGSKWYQAFLNLVKDDSVMYFGEPWWIHYMHGQWEFIRSRPWFRGKAPMVLSGKPGIGFNTGGFVGVRFSMLRTLDWPDRALVHNGGDTLLSEAIRQYGGHITKFPTKNQGIKVNSVARRGYSETPAGARGK